MRILYVLPSLNIGGQERQVVLHATELTARGHEVHVAVPYRGEHFESQLIDAGVSVQALLGQKDRTWRPQERALRVPWRMWRLRRWIESEQFDIVHAFGISSNIYVSAASVGLRPAVVWGIMDSLPIRSRHLRVLERLAAPRSNLAIAVSEVARQGLLQRNYPAEKAVSVHTGVDTERFRILHHARVDAREELGLAPDQSLVGTIGRAAPSKDLPTFIHACALLAASDPSVQFMLVGPGDRSDLVSLGEQLGIADRMRWIGLTNSAERYYNALDVFVSSSRDEGFANTAVEASACGVPCVLTDVGDASALIDRFGYVVPIRNPPAIAEAVRKVLANEQGWTRDSIRESVVSRFSPNVVFNRLEKVYFQLLEDRQ